MMLSIVLTVLGLGMLCVLMFRLAVYALPAFIGFAAMFWAIGAGAGIGCVAIGLVAGVAVFIAGQAAFSISRAPWVRWTVALIFAGPAAYAGYNLALHLESFGNTSPFWTHALAACGAIVVGFTALTQVPGRTASLAARFSPSSIQETSTYWVGSV